MKKRFWGIAAVLSLMICLPAAAKAEIIDRGQCGENVTWTLDDAGTLTVSGEGEMEDYNNYDYFTPWYDKKDYIKNVVIENGVTSIGKRMLNECTNIASIKIPDSVTRIGDWAFADCYGLTDITIPESVTEYGNYLFQGCKSIPEIIIPKGKTFIQQAEYSGCKGAKCIVFNDETEHISMSAFSGCVGLKELVLPDSVKAVSEFAFRDCTGLEYVKISNGESSVYLPSFKDCVNIKTMELPPNIKTVSGTDYSGCNQISYVVDEENEYLCEIDGVLFSKDRKTLISYAKSMLAPSYVIPAGVTEIKNDAFGDYMTDINVPKSVTKISGLNDNIKDVYYMGTADEWNNVFTGRNLNAIVHYNAVGSAAPKIAGTPSITGTENGYTIDVLLDSVEYDSRIIAVAYNNGRAAGCGTDTLSAGDTEKLFTISADTADSVKIFIWDSLGSMKPIADAVEVEI